MTKILLKFSIYYNQFTKYHAQYQNRSVNLILQIFHFKLFCSAIAELILFRNCLLNKQCSCRLATPYKLVQHTSQVIAKHSRVTHDLMVQYTPWHRLKYQITVCYLFLPILLVRLPADITLSQPVMHLWQFTQLHKTVWSVDNNAAAYTCNVDR